MNVLIKFKYRNTNTMKPTAMKAYMGYIESQVKDRHAGVNAFEKWDSDFDTINAEEYFIDEDVLGSSESDSSDDFKLEFNNVNNDYFKQPSKTKIITQAERISRMTMLSNAEKKGLVDGLFTDENADILDVKRDLLNHKGYVWIPIVSLKEDQARDLMVDNEEKWMEKARNIMPMFAEAIGIPESNLCWLAGFHEKPVDEQKEAGKQPHLHFIIWEKNPTIKRGKISYQNLQKMREEIKHSFSQFKEHNKIIDKANFNKNKIISEFGNENEDEINKFGVNSEKIITLLEDMKDFKQCDTIEDINKSCDSLNKIMLKERKNMPLTSDDNKILNELKVPASFAALSGRMKQTIAIREIINEISHQIVINLKKKNIKFASLSYNDAVKLENNLTYKLYSNFKTITEEVKNLEIPNIDALDIIKNANVSKNATRSEIKESLYQMVMIAYGQQKTSNEVFKALSDFSKNNNFNLTFDEKRELVEHSYHITSPNSTIIKEALTSLQYPKLKLQQSELDSKLYYQALIKALIEELDEMKIASPMAEYINSYEELEEYIENIGENNDGEEISDDNETDDINF